MCTVTVLPRSCLTAAAATGDPLRLRLACNRDEQRSRAAALPPAIRPAGGRHAVFPVDPDSGGTWIAASDAGLVFALLNLNPVETSAADAISRGRLIPSLLAAGSVSEALGLVLERQACYRPFRLLMTDACQLVECWLQGGRVVYRRAYVQGPLMRTSSSLGDALVDIPRRALFRQFFRRPANAVAAQDAFHEHRWPGREAVSVRMRRDDAMTVSRCVVELSSLFATMTYRATGSLDSSRVILPLRSTRALAEERRCS